MGAAKKYKYYKAENNESQQNSLDKKIIEQYIKKIHSALEEDPSLPRKAALIIEKMINSKHNK